MTTLTEKLIPLLKKADSLPVLFVGSGFSQRYLGMPTWEELLQHISYSIRNNEFDFARAKNEAGKKFSKKNDYNKYMTKLCDIVSNNLDKVWYSDPKFQDSREKYKEQVMNGQVSPIKIEVSKYIESFPISDINTEVLDEFEHLKLISEKSISGVITTNYDRLLESIFGFETYTSQEELLFHAKYDLAELYKIHGTSDNPESILINSADYDEIDEKHKYISAKLLTIFVEHPVFFIGYSLGDEDVQSILHDIIVSLGDKQSKEIMSRLFFVKWDSTVTEPLWSTYSMTFDDRRTIEMRLITLANYSELYEILSSNKTKYPVKMLRYARKDLYEYALTTKPSSKVVLSLPSERLTEKQLKNIEFIYGFGIIERAKLGYGFVQPKEIFHDILFDSGHFSNDLLITGSLPPALRQSSGFLPIRKYTHDKKISDLPKIVASNLQRFSSYYSLIPESLKKTIRKQGFYTWDQALKLQKQQQLDALAIVDWKKEDIEKLGNYLKGTLDSDIDKFATRSVELRRLIRIYDFFKYK